MLNVYERARLWVNHQENKGLKLILIMLFGCIVAMYWYVRAQVRISLSFYKFFKALLKDTTFLWLSLSVSILLNSLIDDLIKDFYTLSFFLFAVHVFVT